MFSRRDFLKISAYASSLLLVSSGISGCDDDSISQETQHNVSFKHGVASGDPQSDKVIIWTRVTHEDSTKTVPLDVAFEVSTDDKFSNIVNNGAYKANQDSDFTVKIDARNLKPATQYYYRFKSNGKTSPIGKTKTLPVSNPEQVKMVVFSCANYPNGYFNAYEAASMVENVDVTVHLGDYIYEYGMYKNDNISEGAAYATQNAKAIGRELPSDNAKECITLDDYRRRYKLYHTDSGLQAIHAKCPMIVVWDDHEIANDAYKSGADNHNAKDGDYATRTTNALKAYFEWLPIRPVANQKEIYRTFNFGSLVSLHMLETRIFGRDKQLVYGDYYDANGAFDANRFTSDFSSQTRTMLGSTQLQWLQGQLSSSNATWQVLGQQVLMSKMSLPAELLAPIGMLDNPSAFGTTKETLVAQVNKLIGELVNLKMKKLQGATLTQQEEARLSTVMPYNLDAWDGYFVEREILFGTVKALGKNLVALAGDTHNSWSSNLKDMDGNFVGVEFATTSVTSPGLEEYVGLANHQASAQFEGALMLLVDNLKYANTYDRGFMTVTFTADETKSEWSYVDNYNSKTFALNDARKKVITHKKGLPLA